MLAFCQHLSLFSWKHFRKRTESYACFVSSYLKISGLYNEFPQKLRRKSFSKIMIWKKIFCYFALKFTKIWKDHLCNKKRSLYSNTLYIYCEKIFPKVLMAQPELLSFSTGTVGTRRTVWKLSKDRWTSIFPIKWGRCQTGHATVWPRKQIMTL